MGINHAGHEELALCQSPDVAWGDAEFCQRHRLMIPRGDAGDLALRRTDLSPRVKLCLCRFRKTHLLYDDDPIAKQVERAILRRVNKRAPEGEHHAELLGSQKPMRTRANAYHTNHMATSHFNTGTVRCPLMFRSGEVPIAFHLFRCRKLRWTGAACLSTTSRS